MEKVRKAIYLPYIPMIKENSASPQVLKRVINDVTRLYPAKSYGLIVFSHGSGWLPSHTLVNGSRSIIIDNDNEMEITINF